VSVHQAFRRQPVPGQYAQSLRTTTIPAPTRGIVESENEAFMQPGAAIVQDNWLPTMRGVKLRGGCIRWCDLHALDTTVPPVPSALRNPVISAFEYVSGNSQRMYAAQATKLFDVTGTTPVLIKSGQTSGNYAAAQLANAAGYWLIAVNETGDFPLRFDGTTWVTLNADQITGPVGTPVEHGRNLSYVCKYRNRLFFIETKSMNAWYLGIDSIGGALLKIPLSGAATRGGYLIAAASWSVDAGDGIDDKICFITSEGELLIFTGSDPSSAATWKQEGRYQVPPPLGMNAHIQVGGDLLIATVDGIVPVSAAITKDISQLDLAMMTRMIRPLWRDNVLEKRAHPWSFEKWDELGYLFVAMPGGEPGERFTLVSNSVTNAWARALGWDARCFVRMRGDMFFGTEDGIIMQADRTGYDDGKPYVATLVGGWEMFQMPSQQVVWHQARAVFTSGAGEPFEPQLSATTDFIVEIPPPPPAGPDPGVAEVWDQGLWDQARWDQAAPGRPPHRNTMWVSIGMTGFSHAPIVQVTVAQQATPDVELVAIAATYERAGVNV